MNLLSISSTGSRRNGSRWCRPEASRARLPSKADWVLLKPTPADGTPPLWKLETGVLLQEAVAWPPGRKIAGPAGASCYADRLVPCLWRNPAICLLNLHRRIE